MNLKKEIKICVIHAATDADSTYENLHIKKENCEYKFVWDEENPDYLVASELIYYYRKPWEKFVNLYPKAKVRIILCGECIEPDFNLFDYAICFSRNLIYEDRCIRIPTREFFSNLILDRENILCSNMDLALVEYKKRKKFCDFIYSNGNGHVMRKQLFDYLSNYSRVDSYGRYLNNMDNQIYEEFKGYKFFMEENKRIRKDYRFSIACENAKFSGYTSEKIFSCLCAHSIPIYWGNPLIEYDVNPKAMINVDHYDNFERLIEEIDRINNNPEIWASMVTQPWLTTEQIENEKREMQKYEKFLNHIFMQNINDAIRIGDGFHPENYRKWFWEY